MHLRRLFLGSLSFSPRQLTRHRTTNLGLVAAASFSVALISAQAFACDLSEPQKGIVAEVKFGETLALTDGTAVRLVNPKALAAPLSWRVVNEAKEALSQLASGAEVEPTGERGPTAMAMLCMASLSRRASREPTPSPRKDNDAIKAAGIDTKALTGKRLRARVRSGGGMGP
jgi:hypothetical protein